MKVAYCLSGFLRCFKGNNFFENMVSQVPGDVFIHTWDELAPGLPLNINDVVSYYKPNSIYVENQLKFKQSLDILEYPQQMQNYVCTWKSISSSIGMAKDYDVIVRFRPDFIVDNLFSRDEVEDVFKNKNKIYFGASDDCLRAEILTDNFAFGSSEAMSVYANCYDNKIHLRHYHGSHERTMSIYLESFRSIKPLIFACSGLRYTLRRMNGDLIDTNQTHSELAAKWMNF